MARRATVARSRGGGRRGERGPALSLEQRFPDQKFRLTAQVVLSARRWRSELDDRLRLIGTSAARMETLAGIGRSTWLRAQVEIAHDLGIEKGTLTRMLDMLQAEQLVERLPDPRDRRAKLIRLTARGEETLQAASRVASELREQVLEGFEEAELVAANRLLTRLLTRFEQRLDAKPEE